MKKLGRCWDEVEKKPGRTRKRTRTKVKITSNRKSEYEMATCEKRYTTQVMNQSLAIMGNTSLHQRQHCTNAHGWRKKRANLGSEHAMSIFFYKQDIIQKPVWKGKWGGRWHHGWIFMSLLGHSKTLHRSTKNQNRDSELFLAHIKAHRENPVTKKGSYKADRN